jgi:hypothetical protein
MLIPTGMYCARVAVAALAGTSAGTEHVYALFQILEGKHEGQFVPWYGFFTDVTSKQTVEALRYCGWRGYDLANLEGVQENEVTIEVEHGQRTGKTEARVSWVHHSSRLTDFDPMSAEQARAFADRMHAFVLSLKHRARLAPDGVPVRGGDTQRLHLGPEGVPCADPADEIVPF